MSLPVDQNYQSKVLHRELSIQKHSASRKQVVKLKKGLYSDVITLVNLKRNPKKLQVPEKNRSKFCIKTNCIQVDLNFRLLSI